MKELVRHLVQQNLKEILADSLMHCHVKGLHSIMLLNSPGKTIRLYISMPDSELISNNFVPDFVDGSDGMVLGIHPHHCDLRLHCIQGILYNQQFEVYQGLRTQEQCSKHKFDEYVYRSAINSSNPGFALIEKNITLVHTQEQVLHVDSTVAMPAKILHTVSCIGGKITAWFVYEGREDISYRSVCYSKKDLTTFDPRKLGLYQPMEIDQLLNLLTVVNLF